MAPQGMSLECIDLRCNSELAACTPEAATLDTLQCGFVATASCCGGICDPTANGLCDVPANL